MWYSISDGTTWQTLMGSPTPPVNTRIYVSPTTVWSFTATSLAHIARFASKPLHIYPSDSIAIKNASCGNTTDTVFHIFGCACQNNDLLDTVSVTQTGSGDTMTIGYPDGFPLPKSLCNSPTDPVGTPDSVVVHFHPMSTPDVGTIDISYTDNGIRLDTLLHVWGNGVAGGVLLSDPSFTTTSHAIHLREPACADTFAYYEICNNSCSPVTLTEVDVNESVLDTAILKITDGSGKTYVGNTTTQVHLDPGACFMVNVGFLGELVGGTITSSVTVNWTSPTGSGTTSTVYIDATTTTNTHPSFRSINLNAQSCCNVPADTTVYFVNTTTCQDTLTLVAVDIRYGSGPIEMSVDSALMRGFGKSIFPVRVGPQAFLGIPIKLCGCQAGTSVDTIHFFYQFGNGKSASVSGEWDTIMRVHVNSQGETTPTANTNLLSWKASSCDTTCQYKTLTVTAGCKADTIRTINTSFGGGVFSITYPPGFTLPYALKPDQSVTFQLCYMPPIDATGSITVHLQSACLVPESGTSLVTQLKGVSTSEPTAPLSSDNLDFGTIACGEVACDSVLMHGPGCPGSSIKVGFIQQPNADFTLGSPQTGLVLNYGDSAWVHVCTTTKDTGAMSSVVTFQITDLSGNPGIPDSLTLAAYLTPPAPAYTVSQLASAEIKSCDTLDEQFTLVNTGSCYTYVITGAGATDGAKIMTSPNGNNYTLRIAPGDSQVFTVHFDPQSQPKNLTGTITLTDSGGQQVTIPYDITVDSCQATGSLVFGIRDSVITTPNCIQGSTPFTLSAGGGVGTVTSIALSGSPQFSTPNAAGTALPYTGTVTFDPNTGGNDTAVLTVTVSINGTTYQKVVTLVGVTVGTKYSTRIGLESPTNGCIYPNDTDLKQFNVVLGDTLWDSLNVSQLHFLIHYNGDLLWNPKFLKLAPGWSVTSYYEDTMGLHITLGYAGSGQGYTAAGDTILTVTQLGAVSSQLTTTAVMDSTHFNDSSYEACIMKAMPLSGDDEVPVCITIACPQTIIHDAMNGSLKSTPVDSLMIIPNPVRQDGSFATLRFHTTLAAPMTVNIVNELGNPVEQLVNGPVIKGEHIVPIRTSQMAQGAYYVRISMNGYTVVQKFVLEKE